MANPACLLAKRFEDQFDDPWLYERVPFSDPRLTIFVAFVFVGEGGFERKPESKGLFFLVHGAPDVAIQRTQPYNVLCDGE
jgi:hypothetical protein